MKKYVGLVFVFALLFSNANIVTADDGGPNTAFWIQNNKVNCVSFINPEIAGANAFWVFDYSEDVGKALGKSWAIVEKGTCYQINDGTESAYLVKIVNGNEREVFSNYSLYKPTDSIADTFCKNNYCTVTTLGHSIIPMGFLGESVTASPSEQIHFSGINTNALFPTKYDFGFSVTNFSSSTPEEFKPVLTYPAFVAASKLYISLAATLNSSLQSCDSRIRLENQYSIDINKDGSISPYVKNVVWRLADKKDIVVQTFTDDAYTKPDIYNEIRLMGCKETLDNFIKEHQADFATVDRLAEEVIAKYPNALQNDSERYSYNPIRLRSTEPAVVHDPNWPGTYNIPDILSGQNVSSTALDEPTPQKKADMLMHSPNPFMRLYVLLPVLALLGIGLFIGLKKK